MKNTASYEAARCAVSSVLLSPHSPAALCSQTAKIRPALLSYCMCSSVSIVTRLRVGQSRTREFYSQVGQKIMLSAVCRSAPRPTQPLVPLVHGSSRWSLRLTSLLCVEDCLELFFHVLIRLHDTVRERRCLPPGQLSMTRLASACRQASPSAPSGHDVTSGG